MKRGCAELTVIWAAAGYALYTYFHRHFEPPGDLWGAVIGGLLVSWSWGAVRNLFATFSRRSLLSLGETGFPPTDGKSYAAVGTAIALGEPLHTPFQDKECLVYGYSLFTQKLVRYRGSGSSHDEIEKTTYMGGYAMCPFAVRTGSGDIRVLGFAVPDAFPEDRLPASPLTSRILSYMAETPFEVEQGLGIKQKLAEMKAVLTENDGAHRYDWKSEKVELVLDDNDAYVTEQCLPTGAQVCIIGEYSAEKGGLLNDFNAGGMEILLGGIDDALRALRNRIIGYFVTAIVFAALGTLGAYGVLHLRETRSSAIVKVHRERFKTGVQEDDRAKVAQAIQRGVSPNAKESGIDDLLMQIRSKEMLDLLVQNGLDINRHMKYGGTPLFDAVGSRNYQLARWLIDDGADVNARQEGWGTTALERALDRGDREAIEILAAKNALAIYVTAENGSPVSKDGPEAAAVKEYVRAFVAEDAAAVRAVTDDWPDDFFESFSRGLYRGSKGDEVTAVRGFNNGETATLIATCPIRGRSEEWKYTLVKRDGRWKIRRESLQ